MTFRVGEWYKLFVEHINSAYTLNPTVDTYSLGDVHFTDFNINLEDSRFEFYFNRKNINIEELKEDKMNFQEAYLRMLDGKKVRNCKWVKGSFIEIKEGGTYRTAITDDTWKQFLPDKTDVNGNWELYQEEETIEIDGKKFSVSTVKEALKKHTTF